MRQTLYRIWQSAVCEWFSSIRSKRAISLTILFMVVSIASVYLSLSALAKMEDGLAEVLSLPKSEQTGVVSGSLWKSKSFQKIVRQTMPDSLVYDDICGKHPAELIYAFFSFLFVPMLVALVCSNRVSDDLHSGAVRYMITRVTRLEWTLGKYLGQALLLLPGLLLGAFGAWLVMIFKLSGVDSLTVLPAMFVWSLKVWMLSLSWLGIVMGVSHLTSSGAKATVFAVMTLVLMGAIPQVCKGLSVLLSIPLDRVSLIFPSGHETDLWRASFVPVFTASVWLLMIGFTYLLLGYAFFERKDVR